MGAGLDKVPTDTLHNATQEILMLHALRRLSPQPKLTIAIAAILAISLLVAMTATQVAAPAKAKSDPAKPPTAAATLDAASAGTPVTALASQDANCDVGDVCLFYYGNLADSRYDTAHNEPTLSNNHFITAGDGKNKHSTTTPGPSGTMTRTPRSSCAQVPTRPVPALSSRLTVA